MQIDEQDLTQDQWMAKHEKILKLNELHKHSFRYQSPEHRKKSMLLFCEYCLSELIGIDNWKYHSANPDDYCREKRLLIRNIMREKNYSNISKSMYHIHFISQTI